METLSTLLIVLAGIIFLVGVLGLIKPSLVRQKSRVQVLLISFSLLVVVVALSPDSGISIAGVLGILAGIIFLAGIVGLINPSLVRQKSRVHAFVKGLFISYSLLIIAILLSLDANEPFSRGISEELLSLAIVIFLACIVGLIKPSLISQKSRVHILLIFLSLLILVGILLPNPQITTSEVLTSLLVIILLAGILVFIKPSLVKQKSRVQVMFIVIGSLMLAVILSPDQITLTEQTVEPVEQKKESQQLPEVKNKENNIPENEVKDDSY